MKKLLRTALLLCGLAVFALAALLLREVATPISHADPGGAPLTDLAPRPTRTPLFESEPKRGDRAAARPRPTRDAPPRRIAPKLMPDPAHPPSWTATLAAPPPPDPPDPFVAPPIVVDPNHGRERALSHVE
jgi:hypothetical protein